MSQLESDRGVSRIRVGNDVGVGAGGTTRNNCRFLIEHL